MERTQQRGRWAILIALMVALVMAFGLTAAPAQADAATYKAGTPVSQVKGKIKCNKSQLWGTWKLVGSSKKSLANDIKQCNKWVPKLAYKLTMNKNGKAQFKDVKHVSGYFKNGRRYATNVTYSQYTYNWVPTSKCVGYLTTGGRVLAKITRSGNKMVIQLPKLGSDKPYSLTYQRI